MADPPPLNGKSRKKNSIFFGTSLILTHLPGSKEGNHFLKICFANKNSKLNHLAYAKQVLKKGF